MAITPARMLLFLGGASTAALATAYSVGVFDSAPPAVPVAVAPAAPAAQEAAPSKPAQPPAAAQAPEKPAQTEAAPKQERQAAVQQDAQGAPAQAAPIAPTFDILRAEPDGSVVIAGKAAPEAEIQVLSDGKVIATAKATAEGDFATVLDEPLKPGDYQLSLRSTTAQAKVIADSKQTAVISIPATRDGQVLAMVEEPDAPSRIMSKPEMPKVAAAPDAGQAPATSEPAAQPPAAPQPDAAPPAAQTGEPAPDEPAAKPAPAQAGSTFAPVAVEAVEIEGRKIFVAGAAPAGAPVRVYANDQLLGETRASSGGRFLLETQRDLPVGSYQIRADALTADGAKVIARAEVGFSRDPGESVAAVASEPAPAAQSPETTATPAPAAEAQPPAASPSEPAAQQAGPPPAADAGEEKPAPAQPAGADVATAAPADAGQPGQTLKNVSGAVIIRRGDSLWRISRRVYGRGVRYSTIYLANDQQIRDPNRIYPGQVFRVPEKTEQGEAADMKSMGDQATTVE